MPIDTVLKFLNNLPKPLLWVLVVLLVMIVGVIDVITGYEIYVSVLYLFPVMLVAWFSGRLAVALISVVCAVTWFLADMVAGHVYSHIAVPIWNAFMVLTISLIVGYSLSTIKKLLTSEHEHELTDELTHVPNVKHFYERAFIEVTRLAPYRLPITLVCIGIDNLQYINDAFGHATGDDLIQVVAHTVRPMLRPSDFISRLGGAEFALLLPETTDENAANIVAKVHDQLQQVMKKNGWPVTLSIGVVSCKDSSCTVNKLVSAAEALVKVAKNSGGNTVKFKIMDLSPVAPEQPDGASK